MDVATDTRNFMHKIFNLILFFSITSIHTSNAPESPTQDDKQYMNDVFIPKLLKAVKQQINGTLTQENIVFLNGMDPSLIEAAKRDPRISTE
jgi:hypothetical protein